MPEPETAAPVEELEPKVPVEEAPPETPEEPVAPETPVEPEAPAAPEEPSAAALRAQLEEKDAEIARLKAAQPAPEEPAPAPAPAAAEAKAIAKFVNVTRPQLEREFTREGITPQEQFRVLHDLSDHMLGAVLQDKVVPVGLAVIELSNDNELLRMQVENPGAKTTLAETRAELLKLPWARRSEPGIVQATYERILGRKANGRAPAPAAKGPARPATAVSKVLRDVSAGGGAPAKVTASVKLTTLQEAERQELESEAGPGTMPPDRYKAKLEARQANAKANNRKVPALLREL